MRGDGYFFGIELVKDKATKETFDDDESERLLRGFLSKALFDAGLYCRADDRGDPVIQLAPPLTIGQREFDEIEGILRGVLTRGVGAPVTDGRPLWLDDASSGRDRPPLPGDTRADVCIVGRGLHRLWTRPRRARARAGRAVVVRRAGVRGLRGVRPQRRLVLGALPARPARSSRAGTGGTPRSRMRTALHDTVDEVGRAGAALGIDFDYVKGGTHSLVRSASPAQRRRGGDRGRDGARPARARVARAAAALGTTPASIPQCATHLPRQARPRPRPRGRGSGACGSPRAPTALAVQSARGARPTTASSGPTGSSSRPRR